MTIEINKCPLCKNIPKFDNSTYQEINIQPNYRIFCSICMISTSQHDNEEDAIIDWNNRCIIISNNIKEKFQKNIRLVQIGYITVEHECSHTELFNTELDDEQIEAAIVRAATGLKVSNLSNIMDNPKIFKIFLERLNKFGITLVKLPIEQIFIFDGWNRTTPLGFYKSYNELTKRIWDSCEGIPEV